MRTPIGGDDPNVVDHFAFDGHITGTLHNLQITVVARGKQGRSHAPHSDAAGAQRPVLRSVELVSFGLGAAFGHSLASLRRQRRNSSFRPHDHRSPAVPCELGLAPVQPELTKIVMYVIGGSGFGWAAFLEILIQAIAFPLDIRRQFRVRIKFFPGQFLGPFHGSHGVVRPYALQVRMAVGRAWESPAVPPNGGLHCWR